MKLAHLLLAILILTGTSACKDRSSSQGREAVRAACNAEIEKLCAGEDRIGQCLRKHPDELSEGCKAGLGDRR
jgi:hypothetical protein